MYQAPSSPLSIGGVLDSGFRLFRESFTQVFLFAVVTSLAAAPIGLVAPYLQGNPGAFGFLVPLYGGLFVVAIVTLILTSAMVVRIDGVARGEPVSVGVALSRGAQRSPSVLGCGILMTLAIVAIPCLVLIAMAVAGVTSVGAFVAIMALLFIVPGSVIAVWLLFGPYAAIVDRLGPLTSLRYSRAITRGNWWRTTALFTIIFIVLLIIYLAVVLAAGAAVVANPQAALEGGSPWWIQLVVTPLLSAIAAPLSYSLSMAVYYDLKVRYEGGDLAARIAGSA